MATFLERMRGTAPAQPIMKATSLEEELARLERLLQRQEREIARAFREYVRDLKSPRVLQEITRLLEAGDIEGAMRILDTYVTRLSTVLPRIYQQAGAEEAAALAALFRSINPRVAISFNIGDPVAADQIRRASMRFVREFSDRQREATRAALAESLGTGSSTRVAARAFRDSIGLTAGQRRAVLSYRALLQAGSVEALARQLSDRRFRPRDDSLAARKEYVESLSQEQIDRMVERYQARYLAYRSRTIASTEALRVTAESRDEAFRQAAEASGLDLSLVDDIWNSTDDDRVRFTHKEMNRQVRPWGVPFDSPSGAQLRYPGDPDAPAEEVINCRCHKTRRIRLPGQGPETPLEAPLYVRTP